MHRGSSSPFPYEFVSEIPPRPYNSKWRWLYDMIAGLDRGQILKIAFPDSKAAGRARASALNYGYRQDSSIPKGYRLRVISRKDVDGPGMSIYISLNAKPLPADESA